MNVVPEKIKILSIKILGGNIEIGSNVELSKIVSFNVKYGIEDQLFLESKQFSFIFYSSFTALDKDDANIEAKADYKIEFVFEVENIEDYITKKDEESRIITLHNILLSTLLSIVYSTSRGIILSRTLGTSIDGIILPVIDINELVATLGKDKAKPLENKFSNIAY
ncbi:MAG: hypothetical protein O9302_03270 [Cyclobacteriaceae bacterium]|jgi:hypothetical protein|nr:hypothetical protein [Cytophagales bacterium]MCZ8327057.1 hypothetical protein [Cyclobacteriaceae bacterium]